MVATLISGSLKVALLGLGAIGAATLLQAWLIAYFFAGDWFELWMAVVNGGGLVLGGLCMRRS